MKWFQTKKPERREIDTLIYLRVNGEIVQSWNVILDADKAIINVHMQAGAEVVGSAR